MSSSTDGSSSSALLAASAAAATDAVGFAADMRSREFVRRLLQVGSMSGGREGLNAMRHAARCAATARKTRTGLAEGSIVASRQESSPSRLAISGAVCVCAGLSTRANLHVEMGAVSLAGLALCLGWIAKREVWASGAIRYTGRQLCVYATSALAQWHWVAQAWQLQFCIHP